MATMHNFSLEYNNNKSKVIYVKGALEKILHKCNFILVDLQNKVSETNDDDINSIRIELSSQISNEIIEKSEEMAKRGLRIIAFVKREINNNEKIINLKHELLEDNLIFLGFAAMIDPPR